MKVTQTEAEMIGIGDYLRESDLPQARNPRFYCVCVCVCLDMYDSEAERYLCHQKPSNYSSILGSYVLLFSKEVRSFY